VLDSSATDPGLLKKHSTFKSYTVDDVTFPAIRTFYHQHPQAEKLPKEPSTLPLFVFIHGLGGSVAQFSPLLTSLINVAPCLAIDLPGCGLSEFRPKDWEVYRPQQLARLIAEAIRQHRDIEHGQKIVLIGHSLGCSLAALLASQTSPVASEISKEVIGFVAVCPRSEPLSETQVSHLKYVPYIPNTIFNLFRWYDRRQGLESGSVTRYVGKDADQETKRLQPRFNEQSRTPVFLRMLYGLRPASSAGSPSGGLPGQSIWSGINIPIFCISGESDHVCPPRHVEILAAWFGKHSAGQLHSSAKLSPDSDEVEFPVAAGETIPAEGAHGSGKNKAGDSQKTSQHIPEMRPSQEGPPGPHGPPPPSFAFKTAVLPRPAGHGLLYATTTVRIVSGLIESFVSTLVDHRLSLGWQLQHLTTEGKWDVKNLEKWQKILAVTEPIGGIFRAMKTLREVDETHTPKVFVQNWSAKAGVKHGIRMVVDISHESPVYDPKGLEDGGVEYHKFPTVSKLPPTVDEVRAFIALIDTLREHLAADPQYSGDVIAVHCHYGFNRTGFFLVSYLVEKMGYRLQDALDEFATKREPGIKHAHFINELYVRYSPGLQRRPTIYSAEQDT